MNFEIKEGWFEKYVEQSSITDCFSKYKNILEGLAESFFYKIPVINYSEGIGFSAFGTSASIQSISGIEALLKIGDITDSYVLVRKIRDNLLLDLYFLSIGRKNYDSLNSLNAQEEDMEMKQEDSSFYSLLQSIEHLISVEKNSADEQAIKEWIKGEIRKEVKKAHFGYKSYWEYLEESTSLTSKICEFFKSEFDTLKITLNDYVHSNGLKYIDNQRYFSNPNAFIKQVQLINKDLDYLIKFFVCCVFVLDNTSVGTPDFSDDLSVGIEPPEEANQMVQWTIDSIFNEIKIEKPDLYKFLQENNKCKMNTLH